MPSWSNQLCKLLLSLSPPGSCQRSKTCMTKSDSLLRRPKRRRVCISSWYEMFLFSHPFPLLSVIQDMHLALTPCPNQSYHSKTSAQCHLFHVSAFLSSLAITRHDLLVSMSVTFGCVTPLPLGSQIPTIKQKFTFWLVVIVSWLGHGLKNHLNVKSVL